MELTLESHIVVAMVDEMREYILSDILFWPMASSNMPRLTLGGYLMRQHRLLLLSGQLMAEEQAQLHDVMDQYDGLRHSWIDIPGVRWPSAG